MRLHPAEWIRESAGYMKEKNKTGNWLLNAVYPRRCPICDGLLSREELYLCRNCVEKIHPILGARCKKCGKPVGSEEEFCRDCSRTRHSFDRGFAPYGYHGELEASLMRFKYHERQEYAGFYAHAAFFYVGKQIQRRNPEVLVPVPLHPARQRQRGYNQAEVFAEKLAEECPPDPPCEKNKTPERAWSRRAAEKPGGSFCIGKAGTDEILPDSSGR